VIDDKEQEGTVFAELEICSLTRGLIGMADVYDTMQVMAMLSGRKFTELDETRLSCGGRVASI
jgi:hypothetical protein